jgi:flagellar biosynthesis/type III secretory pathway protein FliH
MNDETTALLQKINELLNPAPELDAEFLRAEAHRLLAAALETAYADGLQAGRDEVEEAMEADYEPDVSDEGFDPYLNTYTDDC